MSQVILNPWEISDALLATSSHYVPQMCPMAHGICKVSGN